MGQHTEAGSLLQKVSIMIPVQVQAGRGNPEFLGATIYPLILVLPIAAAAGAVDINRVESARSGARSYCSIPNARWHDLVGYLQIAAES